MSDKKEELKEYAGGWMTERKGTDVPGFLKLAFIVIGLSGVAYLVLFMNGEVNNEERGPLVQIFNRATESSPTLMYVIALMVFVYVAILVIFRSAQDARGLSLDERVLANQSSGRRRVLGRDGEVPARVSGWHGRLWLRNGDRRRTKRGRLPDCAGDESVCVHLRPSVRSAVRGQLPARLIGCAHYDPSSETVCHRDPRPRNGRLHEVPGRMRSAHASFESR